jgi:signal peptidase II
MRNVIKIFGWIILSGLIVGLDQFSKKMALTHLVYQKPVIVINRFFNWYLDFNRGAAFNFLSNQQGWQMWFFSGIALMMSLGIIIYIIKNPDSPILVLVALSLILGGAVGNLIDRIQFKYVVDFISWHINQYYWPTFNIADSAVCVGVVLLFLTFKRDRKP